MRIQTTGDIILSLRKSKGYSQKKLASLVGYKDRTIIAKIEKNASALPEDKIEKMATLLGVTPAYINNALEKQLSQLGISIIYTEDQVSLADSVSQKETSFQLCLWEEKKMNNDFRSVWEQLQAANPGEDSATTVDTKRIGYMYALASERDKMIIDFILSPHLGLTTHESSIKFPITKAKSQTKHTQKEQDELEIFNEVTAAGLGNYLEQPISQKEFFPLGIVPERADFGISVSGDSMEPKIANGSTIFVQSTAAINAGEIGVFVLNGQSFCKQLVIDHTKSQVRLHSINPEYPDMVINEQDEFRTIGRVLGSY